MLISLHENSAVGASFVLNLWVESEEEDRNFAYTEDLLSSYVETSDFLEFAISLDIESLSFARAMELRKLVPSVKSILVKSHVIIIVFGTIPHHAA